MHGTWARLIDSSHCPDKWKKTDKGAMWYAATGEHTAPLLKDWILRRCEPEFNQNWLPWWGGINYWLVRNKRKDEHVAAVAAAKSLHSCPTLCDPRDGSPPGSPVPGILQARTLEWAAISFSSTWKWKVKVKSLSRVWLLATPWTASYQASPPMGFSRQEYWSGVPLPSPEEHVKWR